MELQLDFSKHLPEHLTPSFDRVVTILTQTLPEWPRGTCLLTKERKGIFGIKLWDKSKGETLLGKKIDYFWKGDKFQDKISVYIRARPKLLRYTKPKYVTLVGFNDFPADKISNETLDTILKNFGDIIIPTSDVFAGMFLTGKKGSNRPK